MNINQLRVAMEIKICDDPSLSIKKFGGRDEKMRMAGSIKTIRSICKPQRAVMVQCDYGGHWTIHINDLRWKNKKDNMELLPIKPEIFDPNLLME